MSARWSAAAAALSAVVVAAVTVVAADPEHLRLLGPVVVASLAAIALGVVIGWPAVATLGVVGLVIGYSAAVVGDGSTIRVEVFVVAPLVWFCFEASMRSFETRPDVAAGPGAAGGWWGIVIAVVIGTLAVGLAVVGAIEAAPAGGLTFRILALATASLVAVGLAVINLVRHSRA